MVRLVQNTSFDVGWQCDQLVEPCPRKVLAHLVRFLPRAVVEVPDNQRVLLGVYQGLEVVGGSEEGFILRSVDRYDVQPFHDDLAQLQVGRGKVEGVQDRQVFLSHTLPALSHDPGW